MIRTAIYGLKRTHGKRAIVRLETQSVDRDSGEIDLVVKELEVVVIILPRRHGWEAERDAAYQKSDREFLLDKREINFPFTTKCVIIVNGTKYHTISFDDYDECLYIVGRNESQLA